MKVLRGHHYSFSVADLARSKTFYADVLGLKEIDRPDFNFPGAWFQMGDTQVHLIQNVDNIDVGTPPPELTSRANHSSFEIEDYDSAVETLNKAGVEYLGRQKARQIFLRDPDGNIIELIVPGGRLGS